MPHESTLKDLSPARELAGVLRRVCTGCTSADDALIIQARLRDVYVTASAGGFIAGATTALIVVAL